MKLLRIHVENFGALQNFQLELTDGLNLLYRENGWGKSTLAVFIKAMLYGMPASSKRSLDENERKKYTPWQGGAYGGSLELETAKGRFRIERFFGAKESGDSFALYDLATNQPSNVYSANIGEELFGINADGFERSTYLSQREISEKDGNASVTAKLTSLLDDVDDIGSFEDAVEALEKRRKFYVLTGNRGAIAEAEQERKVLTSDLEHCQRVEAALLAREEEIRQCGEEIRVLQKRIDLTRQRIAEAGTLRERAALTERKNTMLEELAALSKEKATIEAEFNGMIPSAAEQESSEKLYHTICETHARLKEIPSVSPDADTIVALRNKYSQGFPTKEQATELNRRNGQLRDLRARREALQNTYREEAPDRRFAKGTPSTEQIENAFHDLRHVRDQQKAIDALDHTQRTSPDQGQRFPLAAVLSLAVGALLAVLAFMPLLATAKLPLLILAGVALLAGAVLLPVFFVQRSKHQNQYQQLHRDMDRRRADMNDRLQSVHRLLAEYGMPTDGDLSRSLTELNLMANHHRTVLQQHRRMAEELESIRRHYEEALEVLRDYFFDAPLSEDYQPELDRLQRDAVLLARLESEDRKRHQKRLEIEAEMTDMQQRLLPYLRRFDPNGKLRAGECLEQMADRLIEYRRLTRDIREKEAKLKRFIAEKNLDDLPFDTEIPDPRRLAAEEADLQRQLHQLQGTQAERRSSVRQLAVDADRIPELKATLRDLDERIARYKSNVNTVTATARFLEEAKTALSTRYLEGMQKSFRTYLSRLMGKEMPESLLDPSFEVYLREGGQTRTMESFSQGWRDAVRFCLRLALTDALCEEGEAPILLLDDPFVNLDEKRLAAAQGLLRTLASKYQILHMVCHKDRK